MNEQEQEGNCDFARISIFMTSGFQHTFGDEAVAVVFTALAMILGRYHGKADCLQTFAYRCGGGKDIRFWCIHESDHITFLLPEEY